MGFVLWAFRFEALGFFNDRRLEVGGGGFGLGGFGFGALVTLARPFFGAGEF